MLNFLILSICFSAFLSLSSYSEDRILPPIEVKGEFRVRTESRNSTLQEGRSASTFLRLRPDITFRVNPKTFVFFQPQFAKAFGEPTFTGNSTSGNIMTPTSGSMVGSTLGVHQAYGNYQPYQWLQFIPGRQVLSYGDELLIGAGLGWQNVGRSFDALKVRTEYEWGSTDLFFTKLVDVDIFGPNSKDRDFSGLYHSWRFGSVVKALDLYALYLDDQQNKEYGALSLWTLGSRLKLSYDRYDFRGEADHQIGTSPGILSGTRYAYQGDAEIGATLGPTSKTRVAIGGFASSRSFNELFAAHHRYLGTADIFGRRNISGAQLRFSSEIVSDWTLQCDVLRFFRTYRDTPAYKFLGRDPLGKGKTADSASLGTEVDLSVKVGLDRATQLFAGTSILFQGDYFRQNFGDRTPFLYFLQLETRF